MELAYRLSVYFYFYYIRIERIIDIIFCIYLTLKTIGIHDDIFSDQHSISLLLLLSM